MYTCCQYQNTERCREHPFQISKANVSYKMIDIVMNRLRSILLSEIFCDVRIIKWSIYLILQNREAGFCYFHDYPLMQLCFLVHLKKLVLDNCIIFRNQFGFQGHSDALLRLHPKGIVIAGHLCLFSLPWCIVKKAYCRMSETITISIWYRIYTKYLKSHACIIFQFAITNYYLLSCFLHRVIEVLEPTVPCLYVPSCTF